MTPVLFPKTATTFTSNGIGRLIDAISCKVTEERNGVYELEMEYPANGKWFAEILDMSIIAVIHDDNKDIQPFDIYSISAETDGIVTVYAHHVSYRLNNIILAPFVAANAGAAMAAISQNSINANPFSFSTDKTTVANFALACPRSVRDTLMGEEGSFLDVFGKADYKWDKFSVSMLANRGEDTGVTVRFGKNMAGITVDRDESEAYSAIVPFWTDGETYVYPSEYIVGPTTAVTPVVPVVMDMSDQFDEQPTQAQLRSAAKSYLDRNQPWIGKDNIKVDFVAMWQSPEYESVAEIQRVGLCDTVSVYYTDIGIVAEKAKVQRTVYNVLEERFDEIELGTISKEYVAITDENASAASASVNIASIVNQVIARLPPAGVTASDDGNGNVTLSSQGITATDDGNGNVTIS